MANSETLSIVGEIYSTTNYSMFRRLEGNRPVLEARVSKIIDSIENVDFILNPIIVNHRNEIIDGQGRFEALKKLGRPIPFIRVCGIGIKECISMNINLANWKLSDFIDSYAELGHGSYAELKSMMDDYPDFGLEIITNAITGLTSSPTKKIKNGDFEFSNARAAYAREVLSFEKNFVKAIKEIKGSNSKYYYAIAFCYAAPHISNARLLEAVEKYPYFLTPVTNVDQAFSQIEKCYNNNLRKDDRVYIAMEYKKAMDKKYRWYNARYGISDQ